MASNWGTTNLLNVSNRHCYSDSDCFLFLRELYKINKRSKDSSSRPTHHNKKRIEKILIVDFKNNTNSLFILIVLFPF